MKIEILWCAADTVCFFMISLNAKFPFSIIFYGCVKKNYEIVSIQNIVQGVDFPSELNYSIAMLHYKIG